ncbi:carbohydrate ABC transporter permease [Paenibacillus eucommiae]|uniref:Aldouronate transport system permease protein n=1 Tax=Paenibacillus eucommiae TaxID=1355755 RepID=A0ABS4J1U5_9BACL|nr:carbohydrate ABC transporter permease [Paenibacillus eucommiae]MBP1993801.1 putative aldouronate transport system permease protein [Paenibacillus eucommiae]
MNASVLIRPLFHIFLLLLCIVCIAPLVLVISTSFTSEQSLVLNGYRLFPQEFTVYAYKYVLKGTTLIYTSYGVTVLTTLVGTVLSLSITAMLAYPLSRQDFKLKSPLSFYIFFTMLFNGGLIPFYILVTQYLHLKDTLWALILPYLVQPFYVLLMRTFFSEIPASLIEAAKIEGAGEFRTFFQIVLPLSTPILATVGLFMALIYWNDWYLSLLFIDNHKLLTLQYLLVMLTSNIDAMLNNPNSSMAVIPAETSRMAMAVLAIGPIIFVYLFFQRFFVRGLTIGAVKG